MKNIASLLLALAFFLAPLVVVSADPYTHGDDLIETTFSGAVTDSTTNEPIEGIWVYGFDDDYNEWRSVMTDETGSYYLEFNRGGHYTLIADHPDYEQATDDATVDINTDTEIDFALVPKVFDTGVFGIVTDSETGIPLAAVYISIYEMVDDQNGQYYNWVADFQTKDDGKYNFEAYEGTFVVVAGKESYDQYQSDPFDLKSGEALEMNIDLSQWARGISGIVYDENGDPLEGVTVTLEGGNGRRAGEFTATTDENGAYEIRLPWGGQYTLKAFYDGYRPYNEDVQVPQDSMLEQDIDMKKALLPGPLLQILYAILSLIGYI